MLTDAQRHSISDSEVSEVLRLMKEPPLPASHALESAQFELDAHDKRIHYLEQIFNVILEGLRRDRKFLASRIERRRAMYAPVRVLPRDVLVHIFDLVLMHREDGSIRDPDRPKQSLHFRGPRALCTVCHYWRDIIISTPSLWSDVFLELPVLEEDVQRLEACLAYSRNYPLNLSVRVSAPAYSLSYVSQELGRFRRLHLYPDDAVTVEEALRLLLPTSGVDLHRLEELVISDDVGLGQPTLRPQPFLHAPVLTRAVVSLAETGYILRMPPSLTHYGGGFHDVSDYDVLLHCPNLVEVHFASAFAGVGYESDGGHPERRIRHAGLRRIVVDMIETFDFLELPNLSECVIFSETLDCRKHDNDDCFALFLRTSGCTLTHLKKYFTVDSESVYAEYAYDAFFDLSRSMLLSSVTTLDVVLPHVRQTRILDQLSSVDSFPLLRVLGIEFKSHSPTRDFWGSTVEDMLLCRQSSSRPLVEFYAEYRLRGFVHVDKLQDHVSQRSVLQRLERGGLSFLEERPISFENEYR